MIDLKNIAAMIDHSLLHPTMTDEELVSGCIIAAEYGVASVCIKPYAVPLAVRVLEGSKVAVGTVIGFPHGNSKTTVKVQETIAACDDGAAEIDMVINIGKALGNDFSYVRDEIAAVNDAAVSRGACVKVIFENDFLDDKTIISLCRICNEIRPVFIKTSTGYGFVKQENGCYSYSGATVRHLEIMRENSHPDIALKAAGGVRTLHDLIVMRAIGVTRIGATTTANILEEAKRVLARGERLEDLIQST